MDIILNQKINEVSNVMARILFSFQKFREYGEIKQFLFWRLKLSLVSVVWNTWEEKIFRYLKSFCDKEIKVTWSRASGKSVGE